MFIRQCHKEAQKTQKIYLSILCLSVALLFFTGCKQLVIEAAPATAVQISAPGVDAAEPATAPAPDGTFYVAWVNHDAKQADVMIARFGRKGEMQGSPVRVNRAQGVASAWRGDQPSLAVAEDGSVYVVWTARVHSGHKHGTDLHLSVSNDRGQSFASEVKINDDKVPGAHGMHSLAVAKDGRSASLLSQEVVRGTPALAPGNNGAIALWQTGAEAEIKASQLGTESPLSVAANAELPAAVVSNGRLFVAYIAKEKETRSIWLKKV